MRKKVLVFIPEFPVLTETFIEREIDGLAKSKKLNVTVLTLKKGVGFRSKNAKNVTKVKRLDIMSFFSGFSYFFTSFSKTFAAFKVVGFHRVYLFLKALGYTKIFSKESPDILYSHFLSVPSTITLVSSIILNIPLVISAHARDVLEYPDLIKQKVKRAKYITFCNKNAYNHVANLVGDSKNLKITYHGVGQKDLVLKDPISVKKPSKNFIFSIGRVTEKKGTKYLIEASKILREKKIDHGIVVAGGGPLFDQLQEYITELDLEESITLLGDIPFDKLLQYLHLADIYVQPSVNVKTGDADGVPNGVIEAAMLKLPIIGTDAGSFTDFLDSNISILVDQRDSKGLADAIEMLIQDKNLGKVLGQGAHEKAVKMFNISKSVLEIEKLLLH